MYINSAKFDFLNDLNNKKDILSSPVFTDPGMDTVLKDIVHSTKNITTSFRIGAYRIGIVNNSDRENEITDIRHKLKDNHKNIDTYNIDSTVYKKLSLVVIINENRLNNINVNTTENLKRANNRFLANLDKSWEQLEEIGDYTLYNETQHSCQIVDIWVPEIKFSFCEVKGTLYYLSFNKYSKINLIENGRKVHIKRFSVDTNNKKAIKILTFYYISISDEDVINVEFNGKNGKGYNLFNILEHYDIKNTLLEDYPDDYRLQMTYEMYKYEKEKNVSTHITQVECDTSLLEEAVRVLLGYKQAKPFKYYRYGSVVDAITFEIITIIASTLPKATGKRGERYYAATDEDIQKCLIALKKNFKPNLFMSVLHKSDQDGIKSTYNENMVFYPLKVGKTDEKETIFFEDSLGLQDPYGTSQTDNVLKIQSIPPFIDPDYLGGTDGK